MQLILIRHAKAEERSRIRYPDDDLRPLSKAGIQEQKKLSKLLVRMGIKLDHIVTSPRLRAVQTAEIVAREFSLERALESDSVLGDDFSVEAVLGGMSRFGESDRIACVGHEPDLSELTSGMLCQQWLSIDFKKSGVLAARFDGHPSPGMGNLLYFSKPRQLLRLAETLESD